VFYVVHSHPGKAGSVSLLAFRGITSESEKIDPKEFLWDFLFHDINHKSE